MAEVSLILKLDREKRNLYTPQMLSRCSITWLMASRLARTLVELKSPVFERGQSGSCIVDSSSIASPTFLVSIFFSI